MYSPCADAGAGRHADSAAALALLKGIAVHTFFHSGILLVRADLDHIERAEVFAAKIVAALLDGAVDVRILAFVHGYIPLSDSIHAPCMLVRRRMHSHYMPL